MTPERINEIVQQILAHERGEGPAPSREELLAAYDAIRTNRAASMANRVKRGATAAVALPTDLKDLFS